MEKQNKLKVSLKTFGCQMNQYDSEVAMGILEATGHEVVNEDAAADIILMNTCSVREHAEERVYGRLGMIGKAKRSNPNLIVGLMGCMVEEHRDKLFKRFPQLDLMVGTRNIKDLPLLIEEVRQRRKQVARIRHDGISIEYTDLIKRVGANGRSPLHAWLPIMTGCNKVCTFCIVPITRGAEVSMPAREIYREASRLVGEGVKWITLLGQNVNSYRGRHPERNEGSEILRPDGLRMTSDFPQLLEMLCQIEGLERISFTTSHPSDATEELFRVIARNPKISRRFHLPLQSGSDRILKRMKRLHSYAEYKHKIDRMREIIPEVSITTDIIAGFSGEREEDYQATVRALREIRYDGAYIYKYSVRPSAPASKLEDNVSIKVKKERHAELLNVQRGIAEENNRRFLGRTVEVFVEETNPKNARELMGRTHEEKKVVFPGEKALLGQFQKIKIGALKGETFLGTPLNFASSRAIMTPV